MMYRCKICSEHYFSTESLQDHQFASHTEEALEAFGITKVSANETKVLDWQHRSNENKHDILQKMGYPPHDIQTLMSLEFYQFGSNIQKEIGEALNKSTPVKQRTQAVETDENKTYKNMYDSYLQARSAQIKRPFQDGATESKASEYRSNNGGRYIIAGSGFEVDDQTDDLELAKAIANDASSEQITTTPDFKYPQGALKGTVTDMDTGDIIYSAESKASEDHDSNYDYLENRDTQEDNVCAECGFVTSDNSEYLDHLNSHEE